MAKIYKTYEGLPKMPRGTDHPKAKLNEKKVLKIRELHKKGWKAVRIAEKFKVIPQTIHNVLDGVSWRHVP